MSKGSSVLLAIVMAIAGFAVGHVVGSRSATDTGVADGAEEAQAADVVVAGDVERYKVPVSDAQPSKGPKDALVTIVEFSEFQCPFCARVLPTTKQVIDTYGDKVRIVWRNNPLGFHNNAAPAASVAMEAYAQGGNDKFWEVHDTLFANQKALGRPELEGYAEKAGLDSAKVKKALDEGTHKKSIDADQAMATQLGARGTPYFFVNGRQLRGAQPFAAFQKVIDEELATAETLLKQGVKKEQIYATVTKNGLTKAAAPKPQAPKAGQPDPKAVYKVPLKGNEPQKGPNDALVTIVEISDFECPFCGRVEPTLKQVQDKYGKDVRVVWMNNPLPFHKNAKGAANAALEAHAQKGDKGFWAMHNKMFANQKALTTDNLEKWAKEQGLNVSKFKKALADDKYGKTIQEQQALASSLGARGTPAFFINGRNLRGAQPLAAFTTVIDEEMAKAKALVAKGTPRAKVYETTIAKGETGPKTAPAAASTGRQQDLRHPGSEECPDQGRSQSEGGDPGVQRLPVPLLQPGQPDRRTGRQGVRRQGPDRVARLPASLPQGRPAGCSSGTRGLCSEGQQGVLGVPRSPFRQPEDAFAGKPREVRGAGRRNQHEGLQGRTRFRQAQSCGRRRHGSRQQGRCANRHAVVLHQRQAGSRRAALRGIQGRDRRRAQELS